jgi:hypothetical protein
MMHISDKTHRLKDHPTTSKSKGKGPKTIKINKKKADKAFLQLENEIKQLKLHKSKKSQTSNKKRTKSKTSKKK